MEKNLEIREGRQEQWKPTCTPWIFFFFHKNFPMNIQKDSLLFFFVPVSISIIVNAKKSRNSIGKTRAMETHLYTMQFLFSCARTFSGHEERFPPIFFYIPVRISIIMNAHT